MKRRILYRAAVTFRTTQLRFGDQRRPRICHWLWAAPSDAAVDGRYCELQAQNIITSTLALYPFSRSKKDSAIERLARGALSFVADGTNHTEAAREVFPPRARRTFRSPDISFGGDIITRNVKPKKKCLFHMMSVLRNCADHCWGCSHLSFSCSSLGYWSSSCVATIHSRPRTDLELFGGSSFPRIGWCRNHRQ